MSSLRDLLLGAGVSEDDLSRALAYQKKFGGRLEQIAVNMGSLSTEVIPDIYSKLLGLCCITASEVKGWVPPDIIDTALLEFLVLRGWLPYSKDDQGKLVLATKAPFDLEVNARLDEVSSQTEIKLVSEEVFGQLRARFGRLGGDSSESGLDLAEEGRLRELASEAPTVNLLGSLLSRAVRQSASDMHIEPQDGSARVRYRIDGVLHEVDTIPSSMVLPVVTRLKILAGMDIGERRLPQDGKIEFRTAGEDIDIRVSVLPVKDGEGAVLRFLRQTSLVYDMRELGIADDLLPLILQDLAVTSGVVLLTGPTGSGKTTTLYTFLSRLNTPEVKIITLEDPVEYQLSGINQVQVNPTIGFDFAHGLRSVVRQDPDVIMVGEIRDRETASVAMQSALTGHLVFSTVHTNDAPGAFTRLLDLGVEEFLLNAGLRAIIGQRLARKLCVHCSALDPDAAAICSQPRLKDLIAKTGLKEISMRKPVGCEACAGTGYKGRVAIIEYLRCDDQIRAMPKDATFLSSARRYADTQGWRSLMDDGLLKALRGVTTVSEVVRVAG
jgi:general secretion pathway protein E